MSIDVQPEREECLHEECLRQVYLVVRRVQFPVQAELFLCTPRLHPRQKFTECFYIINAIKTTDSLR